MSTQLPNLGGMRDRDTVPILRTSNQATDLSLRTASPSVQIVSDPTFLPLLEGCQRTSSRFSACSGSKGFDILAYSRNVIS